LILIVSNSYVGFEPVEYNLHQEAITAIKESIHNSYLLMLTALSQRSASPPCLPPCLAAPPFQDRVAAPLRESRKTLRDDHAGSRRPSFFP
jgi:hypothetical protein